MKRSRSVAIGGNGSRKGARAGANSRTQSGNSRIGTRSGPPNQNFGTPELRNFGTSEVTDPPLPPPRLQPREPEAQRVDRADDADPDGVGHPERITEVGWKQRARAAHRRQRVEQVRERRAAVPASRPSPTRRRGSARSESRSRRAATRPIASSGLAGDKDRPSSAASARNAGPSVINRKSSDGGYLVTRKNETTVHRHGGLPRPRRRIAVAVESRAARRRARDTRRQSSRTRAAGAPARARRAHPHRNRQPSRQSTAAPDRRRRRRIPASQNTPC